MGARRLARKRPQAGRVAGFPNQLIFYRELESGIDVIRVLHGSRDIDAILGAKDPSND